MTTIEGSSMTRDRTALPPSVARLVWSNLAAQSAEQIGLAAGPIVAVLMLGAGAGASGLLQTAQTLPFLLMSIPAGLLADRVARARLMAAGETLRVLSLAAILALFASGTLSLPLLAALGFVGACGTVAYGVSAPALVPALVERRDLPHVNSRIELARTTAFAAGPAVGGALVGWIGGGAAFATATASSLVAVILLSGIREPERAAAPKRHPLRDIAEGIGFVGRHPLLRPIFLTQTIFNVGYFAIFAVYAPYAIHHLGLDATGVGLTLGCLGAGMVLGAFFAARLMRTLVIGTVIAIGPLAGFAASLLMVTTVWAPSAILAGTAFFLMGAGPILWVVSTTTLRQTVTPPALLGRVTAINSLAYGARPIGAAIGAAIGGWWNAEACLVVAAGGFLVQALVILASPAPRLARLPGTDRDGSCSR
jgi:MFS family permease